MKKKICVIFLFLIFIFVNLCLTISYAAVPVTDENLKESLEKFAEASLDSEEPYTISVQDKVITIKSGENELKLNYDLSTEKPTFSYEVDITKGMTYTEYTEKTENMLATIFGYIVVADIQGVDFEDSTEYFVSIIFQYALTAPSSKYNIIDDLNTSVEKTDDPNTFYASEFPEKGMEYVNKVYENKQTMSDAENGINSFEYSVEKKDIDADSCKLVSTISINLDADFSKINEMASFNPTGITKDNADYVINLKEGQKCKIDTEKTITGYESYGSCIDYDDEKYEIIAVEPGEGILILDIDTEKNISFYITVEKNTNNEHLEDMVVSIEGDNQTGGDKTPTPDKETPEKDNTKTPEKTDEGESQNKIPNAGLKGFLLFIIAIFIIYIIKTAYKLKKYKDIK